MPAFRIAVATRHLTGDLRDKLLAASRLGATGVLLDLRDELLPADWTESAVRDFVRAGRELGLSIAGATIPLRRSLYDLDELDRRVAAVTGALRFAAQLGCPTLSFRCGRIPADAESEDSKTLRGVLSDLARLGLHVGVTPCLLPVWDNAEAILGLLQSITTGQCQVDFDPGQFAMTAVPVVPSLRTLHEWIGHVQLRDGVKQIDGQGQEVTVGQGDVNWLELLATLSEMNYRGWLTAVRQPVPEYPAELSRALGIVQRFTTGWASQ